MPQVQLSSPVVMSKGPAELVEHLRKQNLAHVHLLYPNRLGADLAIPLLFAPPTSFSRPSTSTAHLWSRQ